MECDSPNGMGWVMEEENQNLQAYSHPIAGRDGSPVTQKKDALGFSGAFGKGWQTQGLRPREGRARDRPGGPL